MMDVVLHQFRYLVALGCLFFVEGTGGAIESIGFSLMDTSQNPEALASDLGDVHFDHQVRFLAVSVNVLEG